MRLKDGIFLYQRRKRIKNRGEKMRKRRKMREKGTIS